MIRNQDAENNDDQDAENNDDQDAETVTENRMMVRFVHCHAAIYLEIRLLKNTKKRS